VSWTFTAPGPATWTASSSAHALVLADTACAVLLDAAQRDGSRPDGHWPEHANPAHPEVHQATGITAQLGVSAAVTLIRLRAYAHAHDRRLREAAADVVPRHVRFAPDADGSAG
jgi:hypothetical protein